MYSSGRLHRLRDLQPPVIVVPDPGLCVQNVACDGSAHFTFAKVHFKVVQAKIISYKGSPSTFTALLSFY
jgi:hypothetical protein